MAEQSAICRSPAGEKHVNSGRKRPSSPYFPPADAPGGASVPPALSLFWEGWRHPSNNRGGGRGEACALGAQAAGTYSGDDRWRSDLEYVPAVPGRRQTTAGTSPRARVSRESICVYLRDLRLTAMGARLCFSLCALCLCGLARFLSSDEALDQRPCRAVAVAEIHIFAR